jgi:NDP-sugar pyrophosphorylase family protein
MVLAAGLGTRMRPLTLLRAKPALPVLNRPLLHWTLRALARAGVDEVFVNTHHRPATVRAALRGARRLGVKVRCSHEPRLLGSIGGVRKLRRCFGDAPLLVVNGDMVFDFELRRLIAAHRQSGALATISLQAFPERGRYGAVVTDARGRVLSFGGQPKPARGRAWHFTGIQVLEPRILERLAPGPAEVARDLYGPLIREGALLLGVPLAGPWYDLSSPQLYLASQMQLLGRGFGNARRRLCLDPSARVGGGAAIKRSVIGPGCRVGPRATIADAVLWRGVQVGPGARVLRSVLTDGVRVAAGETLVGQAVFATRPRGATGGLRVARRWQTRLAP